MRRYLKYLLIAFVTLVLPLVQMSSALPPQPSPTQRIVMYSKPAVVRISAGCIGSFKHVDDRGVARYHLYTYGGKGSGFFISPNGYIATQAVITNDKSECQTKLYEKFIADLADEGIAKAEIDKITKDDIIEFNFYNSVNLPNKNSTPKKFEVKVPGKPLGEGKGISIIKISTENAPALKLATADQVQIQEEAIVIGYPAAADAPQNADDTSSVREYFSDASSYEASVVEGKVSNPNKKLEQYDYPILQLDIRSQGYGSAGSPVLNANGDVIGMLVSTGLETRVINWLNPKQFDEAKKLMEKQDAIPLAVPTETIQEFVQSGNVTNEQALLDKYYRDGLDLYWKGDYEGAKKKFEVVKGSFQEHSEVDRLIAESNKNMVERWGKPEIILWSVIGAVVLGLLGLVGFLLWRKPRSVSKSSASTGMEKRPRPHITGYPAENGVGQSWIELEGQGQFRRLQLTKETHQIGRDPAWSEVEIPASWEVLSRRHALLKREGNSYRIFDGDGRVPSRNGLFIDNYTRVDLNEGYLLKPGDTLIIGKDQQEQVRLTYYNPTASQATPETKVARS